MFSGPRLFQKPQAAPVKTRAAAWRFEARPRQPFALPGESHDPSIVLRAARALTVVGIVEPPVDKTVAPVAADPNGHGHGAANGILMSWTSQDGGDSFNEGVVISDAKFAVSGHGETAPFLALGRKGLCVVFEQKRPDGKGNDLMASWSSMASMWTKPVCIAPKAVASGNSYASVAAGADGLVAAAWLDSRDKSGGGPHVFVAISEDGGKTWGDAFSVAAGACPCCRPGIAISDKRAISVSWRNVETGDIRDIFTVSSTDGGKSFSKPKLLVRDGWRVSGCPHTGCALAYQRDILHAAWYSAGTGRGTSGVRHATSASHGNVWDKPVIISGGTLDPNHPMISSTEGTVLVAFQARPTRGDGWEPYAAHVVDVTSPATRARGFSECPAGGKGVSYPRVLQDAIGRAWVVSTAGHKVTISRARRA